jgi:hypothetical protein
MSDLNIQKTNHKILKEYAVALTVALYHSGIKMAKVIDNIDSELLESSSGTSSHTALKNVMTRKITNPKWQPELVFQIIKFAEEKLSGATILDIRSKIPTLDHNSPPVLSSIGTLSNIFLENCDPEILPYLNFDFLKASGLEDVLLKAVLEAGNNHLPEKLRDIIKLDAK